MAKSTLGRIKSKWASKRVRASKRIQYFRLLSKQQLIEAQQKAELWDYNRQIHPQLNLSELGDFSFPVTMVMPHHHRCMTPCEEHYRILVFIPNEAWKPQAKLDLTSDQTHLLFDVSAEFFRQLKGELMPVSA